MHAILLVAVLAHVGSGFSAPRQANPPRADLCELNHFADADGQPVFDQFIFYRWDRKACRFQVAEWRLVKEDCRLRYDYNRRVWIATGRESSGKAYEIHATAMKETWTQHDPELLERKYLPQEQRDPFFSPMPAVDLGGEP